MTVFVRQINVTILWLNGATVSQNSNFIQKEIEMAYLKCECGFSKEGIPESYAGKRVKCPKCEKTINIGKMVTDSLHKKSPVPPPIPHDEPPKQTPVVPPLPSTKGETDASVTASESFPEADSIAGDNPVVSAEPALGTKKSFDEFSLLKDYDHVLWGPTYMINFIRVNAVLAPMLLAGLVSALGLHGGGGGSSGSMPSVLVPFYVGFGLLSAPVTVPLFSMFFRYLSEKKIPFTGLLHLAVCLPMMMIGDPVLFFLKKIRPDWVPVTKLGFFNLTGAIIVFDETFE